MAETVPSADQVEIRRLRRVLKHALMGGDNLKKLSASSRSQRDEVLLYRRPPGVFPIRIMCAVLEVSASGYIEGFYNRMRL